MKLTLKQYYSLALVIAPFFAIVLIYYLFIKGSLGDDEETWIANAKGIFLLGMVGYIPFAPYMLYRIRKCPAKGLLNLSFLAPLLYLPFCLFSCVAQAVLGGGLPHTISEFLSGTTAMGVMMVPIILAIGYTFVGVVHLLRVPLQKTGIVEKEPGLPRSRE